MKVVLLTCAAILAACSISAQTKRELQEKIKDGSYTTSVGWTIKEDDAIPVGVGTLPNHNFAYIYKSPQNAMKMLGSSSSETSDDSYNRVALTPNQAKVLNIKSFFLSGSKKGGYTVMARVGVGGMANYWVDIENAVLNGEIKVPAQYASKIKNNTGETSGFSAADELKKYKDLLDSGAISKEEYEAKKKELLGL